jgi:hypothetical protein
MASLASAGSGKIERLSSIDAQLRLLVPGKLSEDDKLIEYDALLLDRFLDVLQGLHGDDLREMVCNVSCRFDLDPDPVQSRLSTCCTVLPLDMWRLRAVVV